MESLNTFWQLVSKYRIEIPVFQRDYAQGRSTEKATQIRKTFIKAMLNAITKDEPMQLQFIYGRITDGVFIPVDGQQRLTTLYLLHLYLIQFCPNYNHEKCNSCQYLTKLRNFTYATRQSSREFCEKITDSKIFENNRKLLTSNDTNLEKFIVNQPWFFANWKKDPTIRGMLRTLQEIHQQIRDLDLYKLREKLFNDNVTPPIQFEFLDMGEHSLTDDLYLKMNSRGLPLDSFDIFKTQFEEFLKQKKYDIPLSQPDGIDDSKWEKTEFHKKVTMKFDLEWYNTLWQKYGPQENQANEDNYDAAIDVSQRLLGVIARIFRDFDIVLSHDKPEFSNLDDFSEAQQLSEYLDKLPYLSQDDKDSVKKLDDKTKMKKSLRDKYHKYVQDELTKIAEKPESYIVFTPFEKVFETMEENSKITLLKYLFIFLDNLKYLKCKYEETSLENELKALGNPAQINSIRTWALWEDSNFDLLILQYKLDAIVAAIAFFGKPIQENQKEFYDWLRIVWNIVENYDINNGTFSSFLQRLWNLSDGSQSNGILQYLANIIETIKKDGVAQDAIEDECEKAKLILTIPNDGENWHNKWYEYIENAEKHPLMKGCIRILWKTDILNSPENFKNHLDVFSTLFIMQDYVLQNGIQIGRALLSFDDYSYEDNDRNCYFPSDDLSWRIALHIKKNKMNNLQKVLFNLLDDKLIITAKQIDDTLKRNGTINEILNGIINDYIGNCSSKKQFDWRYYFVKYYNAFLSGKQHHYSWINDLQFKKLTGKDYRASYWDPFDIAIIGDEESVRRSNRKKVLMSFFNNQVNFEITREGFKIQTSSPQNYAEILNKLKEKLSEFKTLNIEEQQPDIIIHTKKVDKDIDEFDRVWLAQQLEPSSSLI